MTKRIWIACGLLLAAVSLSSVSGAGREAAASEKWVARYNGPGNGDDAAAAVALDVSGNLIIVGTSAGSGTGTDVATVKLDAGGNLVWARLYDGPAHGDDAGKDIAVDAAGNIFVLGSTKSATGTDITAVKYSPAGKRLWVKKYDGTGHGDDEARGIALDSQGAAIVCGTGRDGHTNPYAVVIKYGTKGARLWIKRGIPVSLNVSMATDVVVDPSDNIYVCGGLFDANWDLLTAKYDRNGVLAWAKSLNGTNDRTDVAAAVAVTASGAVTIIGSIQRAVYNDDYATVRYDKNGGLMWAKTYNGSANRDESPTGLAVDALGNAHVTGWSGVADSDYDFATVKYSPTARCVGQEPMTAPTLTNL